MTGTSAVLRMTGPEEVAVRQRPRPEPADEEVLVRTDRTLISTGTEMAMYSGDYPSNSRWDRYADYPVTPGYMNLGTVVEGRDGPAEGTRVVSFTPHAEYVTPDADGCYPVPEGVDDDAALLFAVAEIAMHALRRGRVDWGETVAVFGLGLFGQLAVRIGHFAGARPVVGVNRSRERLDLLPDVGGVVGLSTHDDGWLEALRAATGGDLADVVVEATGNADAIAQELDALRRQGRLVVLGCPQGETTLDFHDQCNWPSYELIGAHISSRASVETPRTPWTQRRYVELFFEILGEPAMEDVGDLVTRREPYANAGGVYDDLHRRRTDDLSAILEWT